MDAVINGGLPQKIHLYHQPKKTRSGCVDYYSLATCYKEDGKNKKRIIHRLGRLTPEQAQQYRILVQAVNSRSLESWCSLDKVIFSDEMRYFDVLLLSYLWEHLGLSSAFSKTLAANQRLSTENVARILTINRLLAPTTKVRTISWLSKTLLPKILGVDSASYRKTKIFDELDKIHALKPKIERLFADFSAKKKGRGYDVYFFDGTTSWFEGSKCTLAKADLEKTRGHYPKVVALMLVTDRLGYPVAWEAHDGNTKDTSCFEGLAQRLDREYGINEVTYCFDRGIASSANFSAAAACRSKFISGIKDNQIKAVFDLDRFEKTRTRILAAPPPEAGARRRIVDIDGFTSHDQLVYFKDLGVSDGLRYIASFNIDAFVVESNARQKRLEKCLACIADKNQELSQAKKDRDFGATERDLLAILAKFQMRAVVDYALLPLSIAQRFSSYKIEATIDREKCKTLGQTDGLMLYVSDHVEQDKHKSFLLHASEIIAHYKRKYIVENAFRELKSFVELRPFHVWTESHVKAHYDVAVIACFINNYILECLKAEPTVDEAYSLRDFYEMLQAAGTAIQLKTPSGVGIHKMKALPATLPPIIERLGLSTILSPALHTSHGVFH